MSEPDDPAALLNVPVEFLHGGKAYKSRKLDLLGVAKFCSWLEQRATEAAWRTSADLPAGGREAVLAAANQDIAAGVYRPGGAGYMKALAQPEAGAQLLYLSLQEDHPDLTPAECQEMFLAKLDERARDALRAVGDSPKGSGGRKASSGPSGASSRSSKKKASRRSGRRG